MREATAAQSRETIRTLLILCSTTLFWRRTVLHLHFFQSSTRHSRTNLTMPFGGEKSHEDGLLGLPVDGVYVLAFPPRAVDVSRSLRNDCRKFYDRDAS